jgi:signal transduction histidine kinase
MLLISRAKNGNLQRLTTPLSPDSLRLLFSAAIGVLIWLIWLTGMLSNSRQAYHVTMLALSAVSILGLGLVLELRKRFVTEAALRHARDDAENANRAKSQFLATMSHELRTPLNAIIGFSDIMQSEVWGPVGNERYRSYANDIYTSGTHLLQIINDILDLTRAEVGKLELAEETIGVGEIIHTVVRLSRAIIEKAGLTVTIEVAPDLPPLRGDERKIRQMLFNLVGNAVKFTPAGGHIAVSAWLNSRGAIEIAVADTGIGIAREDLSRVLEPFTQIDSLLSRHHDGTGLGLPAVKAMIERHAGSLDFSSALGAGTTATLIFPPERTMLELVPAAMPQPA